MFSKKTPLAIENVKKLKPISPYTFKAMLNSKGAFFSEIYAFLIDGWDPELGTPPSHLNVETDQKSWGLERFQSLSALDATNSYMSLYLLMQYGNLSRSKALDYYIPRICRQIWEKIGYAIEHKTVEEMQITPVPVPEKTCQALHSRLNQKYATTQQSIEELKQKSSEVSSRLNKIADEALSVISSLMQPLDPSAYNELADFYTINGENNRNLLINIQRIKDALTREKETAKDQPKIDHISSLCDSILNNVREILIAPFVLKPYLSFIDPLAEESKSAIENIESLVSIDHPNFFKQDSCSLSSSSIGYSPILFAMLNKTPEPLQFKDLFDLNNPKSWNICFADTKRLSSELMSLENVVQNEKEFTSYVVKYFKNRGGNYRAGDVDALRESLFSYEVCLQRKLVDDFFGSRNDIIIVTHGLNYAMRHYPERYSFEAQLKNTEIALEKVASANTDTLYYQYYLYLDLILERAKDFNSFRSYNEWGVTDEDEALKQLAKMLYLINNISNFWVDYFSGEKLGEVFPILIAMGKSKLSPAFYALKIIDKKLEGLFPPELTVDSLQETRRLLVKQLENDADPIYEKFIKAVDALQNLTEKNAQTAEKFITEIVQEVMARIPELGSIRVQSDIAYNDELKDFFNHKDKGNPFTLLKLDPGAIYKDNEVRDKAIHKAWVRVSKAFHPDKVDKQAGKQAEKHFIILMQARDYLINRYEDCLAYARNDFSITIPVGDIAKIQTAVQEAFDEYMQVREAKNRGLTGFFSGLVGGVASATKFKDALALIKPSIRSEEIVKAFNELFKNNKGWTAYSFNTKVESALRRHEVLHGVLGQLVSEAKKAGHVLALTQGDLSSQGPKNLSL